VDSWQFIAVITDSSLATLPTSCFASSTMHEWLVHGVALAVALGAAASTEAEGAAAEGEPAPIDGGAALLRMRRQPRSR
jgi:hypothetical protein